MKKFIVLICLFLLSAVAYAEIREGRTNDEPLFKSSPARSITTAEIAQWNTAYKWGLRSSSGFLTEINSAGLDNVWTTNGLLRRTAARTYTVDTNNYLVSESDPCAALYLNQSVKTSANPTFATVNATAGYKVNGTAGVDANVYINDSNSVLHLLAFKKGILTGNAVFVAPPVAWYKMNDNADSNTVIDSQLYSNGTSVRHTSTLHTTGKVGSGALTFNGTSDYIDTNSTFQSVFRDSFSMNLLFKATDGIIETGRQSFCGIDKSITGYHPDFEFYIDNAGYITCLYGTDGNPENAVTSPNHLSDGQQDWIMATVVINKLPDDMMNMLLYINGLLVATSPTLHSIMSNFANFYNLPIGATLWPSVYDGFFLGSLDDVRIFNRALTPDEIGYLWNGGAGTEN